MALGFDWRPIAERPPSDVICGPDGKPYMERFNVRWGLRLHHILRSDPDRDLHDHPWNYKSLLLEGSYTEVTGTGEQEYTTGDILARTAQHAHRLIVDEPMWTAFHFGPFVKTWGFHTPAGWVPWRTYLGQPEPSRGVRVG